MAKSTHAKNNKALNPAGVENKTQQPAETKVTLNKGEVLVTFKRDTTAFESSIGYKAGDTLVCNQASAKRWIKLNAATITQTAS